MKLYSIILGVGLLSVPCAADEFVIAKNKTSSTKDAKAQCCQTLTDSLRLSPELLEQIAQMQKIGLEMATQMLEEDLFKKMSKVQLQQVAKEYEEFAQRQDEINALLEEQVAFLEKQRKGIAQSNNSKTVVT